MPNNFKDPVCGMQVSLESAADSYVYKGRTFYFCSPSCREAFEREPAKYLGHEAAAHAHGCC